MPSRDAYAYKIRINFGFLYPFVSILFLTCLFIYAHHRPFYTENKFYLPTNGINFLAQVEFYFPCLVSFLNIKAHNACQLLACLQVCLKFTIFQLQKKVHVACLLTPFKLFFLYIYVFFFINFFFLFILEYLIYIFIHFPDGFFSFES